MPAELYGPAGDYTVELIDVDEDRYWDLVIAGHEFDGSMDTTIYWGDLSGRYDASRKTVLPAVEGWGIVLDIDAEDLDGDGLREVVLNRTRSDPFYEGYYLQIVAGLGERAFADATAEPIVNGSDLEGFWFGWLRLQDANADGHRDIVTDDEDEHDWTWLNDGNGVFVPLPQSVR